MRRRLLEWLCCPVCRDALALEATLEQGAEIEEGWLTCAECARLFPIIGGIPRMLPDELAHLVLSFHQNFFRRHVGRGETYRLRCQGQDHSQSGAAWQAKRRTLRSYSYQWRRFKQMLPHWESIFCESIHPVTPDFFPGKVGLDAGCGFGRSLVYAAHYGAEMIGLDLSEAVESARENTRHLSGVHVVQGDIYHPPLRPASLDFVYSIGVLHHLPSPRQGFISLSTLLAPGGRVFIWVYSRGRGRQIRFFTAMRAVSTRLPYRTLNALCAVCAAIEWTLWVVPFRLLDRVRLTKPLARRLPLTYHARFPFYVAHTDWFDGLSVPLVNYYKQDEIAEWFREAGLRQEGCDPQWGKDGGGRALGTMPARSDAVAVRVA